VHPPLNDNQTDRHDYFIIAASEKKCGFRCDSVIAGEGIDGEAIRGEIIIAFMNMNKMVHDVNLIWLGFVKCSGQASGLASCEK